MNDFIVQLHMATEELNMAMDVLSNGVVCGHCTVDLYYSLHTLYIGAFD